jgi:uncharacterized protein YacL (UPF0231 family)
MPKSEEVNGEVDHLEIKSDNDSIIGWVHRDEGKFVVCGDFDYIEFTKEELQFIVKILEGKS